MEFISVGTPQAFGSGYPQGEIPEVVLHPLFGYTSGGVCELLRAGTSGLVPPSAQCLA